MNPIRIKPRRSRTPEVITGHPADFSLMLTLPCRVVSEANQRGHWGARASRAKKQRDCLLFVLRELGFWSVLSGGYRWPFTLPTRVEFTHIGPEIDDDNLRGAFKALRDEVADWAGKTDRDPALVWNYRQVVTNKPDEFRCEIKLAGAF